MTRSLWTLLAGLALAVPAGSAQEGRTGPSEVRLSLRECIHLALNHNLDVEISRYQPWIDDQSVQSAFGSFDYVFYADGSGGRNRLAATTLLAGAPEIDSESALLKTGMRRTLPIGALVDLSLSFDRQKTNSSFAILNPIWQESLGLSLTVPVLKGAGDAANLTPILLARNARRLSVDQFEKLLGDTVFSVQEAYWGLVSAIEQKRFRDQALEVARKLLEDNKRRFDRGVLAKVDVTQAESGVASQIEGILTAENAVQDAMDRLKRLVDPALLREEVSILPVDAPPAPEGDLDERAAIERGLREAIEKRPEYRQIFVQIDSQDRTIEKARNDALPRLNAIASGSFTGIEDGFSGAADELRSADTYAWTVGISVEIPLENRTAAGAVRKGELERRRLLLQRRNLEDQILVEVRESVREIKTSEKRIDATRQAALLAREQFEGEENRRDQGLRTTFHVLDARSKLTEALTNEVRARIDHATAWARHRRATGLLLAHHGILVESNLAPRHAVR
jgi:outer membrane protein TolC